MSLASAWKSWGLRAQSALNSSLTLQESIQIVNSLDTTHPANAAKEHLRVRRQLEFLQDSDALLLSSLLIRMYSRCGSLGDAQLVFDGIRVKDIFVWNALLAAYARYGHLADALRVFEEMPEWDLVSINSLLAVVFLEADNEVALICFESMPARDICSLNIILSANARQGRHTQAESIFERMPERDVVTWNIMLGMHIYQRDLQKMTHMFNCMEETDLIAWNSILLGFSQQGMVKEAVEWFDQMPCRDMISYKALLSCHAKSGNVEETRIMFNSMEVHDSTTENILLSACSSSLKDAKAAFELAVDRDQVSWSTLLDACIRNGEFNLAEDVFRRMPEQDEISMTSMLVMRAQGGDFDACFELFNSLLLQGMRPDEACFTSLFLACIHSGNSMEAWRRFRSQMTDFDDTFTGLRPSKQQFACVIDLLGRAGNLEHVEDLISNMPYIPDEYEWVSMLSSSKLVNQSPGGIKVPESLQRSSSSTYMLLANAVQGNAY